MLHVYPCFASKRRWTCRSWEKSYFSPKQWGIACIAQHAKLFIQILTASLDFTSNILSTAGTAGLWHLLLTHTSHFLKLSPRSVVDTSSVCWDFGKSWEVRASMGGKKLWNILKHPETSWKPIWRQQLAAASYRYFSEAEMTWSETSVDRFAEPRWKQWLRRNCAWFSNRAIDQHMVCLNIKSLT